jgi:hypothetical protein
VRGKADTDLRNFKKVTGGDAGSMSATENILVIEDDWRGLYREGLCLMRTLAVHTLSHIAVMAKRLEFFRKTISNKPSVKSTTAPNSSDMLRSAAIEMVNAKKLISCFSAARAFQSVVTKNPEPSSFPEFLVYGEQFIAIGSAILAPVLIYPFAICCTPLSLISVLIFAAVTHRVSLV